MRVAQHTFRPMSDAIEEQSNGACFTMTNGEHSVRCVLERSAWQARVLERRNFMDDVRRNFPSISLLASQKLSLAELPIPTQIQLTADDLFNIVWLGPESSDDVEGKDNE